MVLAPPICGNCYEIIFLLSEFFRSFLRSILLSNKNLNKTGRETTLVLVVWYTTWLLNLFSFSLPNLLIWPVCFLSVGNVAHYSSELTERVRSNNATSNGVRMQFKSPINRNTTSRNNFEKNVSKSPVNQSFCYSFFMSSHSVTMKLLLKIGFSCSVSLSESIHWLPSWWLHKIHWF